MQNSRKWHFTDIQSKQKLEIRRAKALNRMQAGKDPCRIEDRADRELISGASGTMEEVELRRCRWTLQRLDSLTIRGEPTVNTTSVHTSGYDP